MKKAVLHNHTADRLMDIHRKSTEISNDDDNPDLRDVFQTAVNALIQHEVCRKESTATPPSTPKQQEHHHMPSKEKTQYQLIRNIHSSKLAKGKLHKFPSVANITSTNRKKIVKYFRCNEF